MSNNEGVGPAFNSSQKSEYRPNLHHPTVAAKSTFTLIALCQHRRLGAVAFTLGLRTGYISQTSPPKHTQPLRHTSDVNNNALSDVSSQGRDTNALYNTIHRLLHHYGRTFTFTFLGPFLSQAHRFLGGDSNSEVENPNLIVHQQLA